MRPFTSVVSIVALAVYLAAVAWLGALERGGPPHAELVLPGAIPATLYLPPAPGKGRPFYDPLPRDERPPAVVLMHGFASDRLGLSTLARRLAHAGYAVLTLDVRGHGQNRTPFGRSEASGDTFFPDLSAAVDFLRASPLVDGSRIVVAGHSMGAGASLDYGTRDSGIDAVVLISGGWRLEGPYRPPNALFIYAAGDPERIRTRASRLAAAVAGQARLEPGRRYGDVALGTGVRLFEVPGTDHGTIVWSERTAAEIIAWLDAVFGREGASGAVAPEPRLRAALIVALAMLLVLPGLGTVVARMVPAWPERSSGGAAAGLGLLAAALALAMIPLAVGTPAPILSVEVGDVIVAHFALAGVALLVGLGLRGHLDPAPLLARPLPTGTGAAVAVLAVFVLMNPLGVVFHRITLTPERTLVFALATLGILPFSLAFQLLLRRGRPLVASLYAVAGRVLVLVMLVAGVRFGVLSPVVLLMLPALAIVFALMEVLAASLYAASRNLLAIGLIDAAWLALIIAAIMPVRI